jgi:hypothetical protein
MVNSAEARRWTRLRGGVTAPSGGTDGTGAGCSGFMAIGMKKGVGYIVSGSGRLHRKMAENAFKDTRATETNYPFYAATPVARCVDLQNTSNPTKAYLLSGRRRRAATGK